MAVWKLPKNNRNQALLDQALASRGLSREALTTHPRIDPLDVPGMGEVTQIVLDNLDQKIAIFGDYDCDGICAAAVLAESLRRLGNEPVVRLPNRDEGYGIKPFHVKELAERGVDLIITVDNGVTACAAVTAARELGIKMAVTDHHEPQEKFPECPVADPKLPGSTYREYSGTGVAYLLSCALFQAKGRQEPKDLLDLVALATVVDCCPIEGPNYLLARRGLLQMRTNPRLGIGILASVAGVKRYDGYSLGWQIGPRINAAGRMGDPYAAYELLTTDDGFTGIAIADELDSINRQRQELVRQATEECLAAYDGSDFPVFVTGYPHGVVGVISGRVAEAVRRPVVVGSSNGGLVTASGRSVGGFDLFGALTECQRQTGLLGAFGGHKQAAGLSFDARNLPRLQEALNRIARANLKTEDIIEWVDLDGIIDRTPSLEEVWELDLLEPCPAPVYALAGLVERVKQGDAWKLISVRGLSFFVPPEFPVSTWTTVHAAITPVVDNYRGIERVFARAVDVRAFSVNRETLAKAYTAWQRGEAVNPRHREIFAELGLSKENSGKVNLLNSRTFQQYGIVEGA